MTGFSARGIGRRSGQFRPSPLAALGAALVCACLAAPGPGAASTPPSPEVRGSSTGQLEVLVLDRRGQPVPGLEADRFRLATSDRPSRVELLDEVSAGRHVLVFFDLPSTPPADRLRVLPALGPFLERRLARGDRVTVAILRRQTSGPAVETLCVHTSDPRAVRAALRDVAQERALDARAPNHRRIDRRHELRSAYDAFSTALDLARGDARSSLVLYSGGALATAGGTLLEDPAAGELRLRAVPSQPVEDQDAVGSVQYLVTLPRASAPSAAGRGAGDRLLAAALLAEAAIYPLVPGRETEALGSGLWLAEETGGRPIAIRGLAAGLDRLDSELDHAYTLRFAGLPSDDAAFRRLRLEIDLAEDSPETPAAGPFELRHARALPPTDPVRELDDRARAAWTLCHRADSLGLRARLVPAAHGDPAVSNREESQRSAWLLELVLPGDLPTDSAPEIVVSLAVPVDGGLSSRQQRLRPRSAAGRQELRLRLPLRLPPGTPGIGLAVRDARSGLVASLPLLLDPARPRGSFERPGEDLPTADRCAPENQAISP